ncbi:hypothetical protein ACFLV6_00590 [Chloroflexota bacterium]
MPAKVKVGISQYHSEYLYRKITPKLGLEQSIISTQSKTFYLTLDPLEISCSYSGWKYLSNLIINLAFTIVNGLHPYVWTERAGKI